MKKWGSLAVFNTLSLTMISLDLDNFSSRFNVPWFKGGARKDGAGRQGFLG